MCGKVQGWGFRRNGVFTTMLLNLRLNMQAQPVGYDAV